MSARYAVGKLLGALGTLVFVVVFNFFLFRIVATDPVAVLYRGRNLSDSQRDELTRQFGLDGSQLTQFLRYVEQTVQLNFGRSYATNRGVMEEIWSAMPATIALVGVATILSTVFGLWMGAAAGWRRGTTKDRVLTSSSMVTWSMPDFWLGMLLLTFFSVRLDLFPTSGITDPASDATGLSRLLDQAWHMALPCATLAIAYVGEYALVMRSSKGEYHLSGAYEEIDAPSRLVMTWKWKTSDLTTRVTIQLRPEGDGTHLRLSHIGFDEAEQASSHNQGWTSSLNDLERYLAS